MSKLEEVIISEVFTELTYKNHDHECLISMVERFVEDGVIDSDEIIELVQFVMESVEKKKELSGDEKKKTAMSVLKQFMEKRVNNWSELEKLISKAIDFGVDVSKNGGLGKVIISSITINDTKAAFNLIYSSTMSKINEKYPLADDIMNNLFDIAIYTLELIEGQTKLKENEKKILLKKILNHIVNTTSVNFTDDQKELLKSNIDSTVSLITIGWRTIESGELNVRPEEVISIFSGCFQWLTKCFKKNQAPALASAPAPTPAPEPAPTPEPAPAPEPTVTTAPTSEPIANEATSESKETDVVSVPVSVDTSEIDESCGKSILL